MNCLQITACQLPCALPAYPKQVFLRYKALPAYPKQVFLHYKADIRASSYFGTKLPKSLKLKSAASRYEHALPVCLFGGKGKSENGNQDSPWKAIEKAVSNFKKDQSIEDVLRQQIQKKDYYNDGDGGGKGPGGSSGGGDGGGFGEDENEGESMWEEFGQVILATLGFIFLYIYIIEGEEINVLTKDILRFLFTRQMSIRLNRLINQWKRFLERMKEKEEYDPDWLQREIINTTTSYDGPAKYMYFIRTYLEGQAGEPSYPNTKPASLNEDDAYPDYREGYAYPDYPDSRPASDYDD